jgi:hypothetical protein
MVGIASLVRLEMWLFLLGLAVLVAYALLTGRIPTRGLLCDDPAARQLSPNRIQLLLLTLAGAFSYMWLVARGIASGTLVDMPRVPNEVLLVVGSSNLGYLAGKSWTRLVRHWLERRFRPTSRKGDE